MTDKTERVATVFGVAPEKLLRVLAPLMTALIVWGFNTELDRRELRSRLTKVEGQVSTNQRRIVETEKLSTRLELALRSINASIVDLKSDIKELRSDLNLQLQRAAQQRGRGRSP